MPAGPREVLPIQAACAMLHDGDVGVAVRATLTSQGGTVGPVVLGSDGGRELVVSVARAGRT